jgi:protein-L-isoaspartate(D-aspartate) O-methyltransferase
MEAVPRTPFVSPRHAELAFRDIALPAPCGQSVAEPLFVARMLAAGRLDRTMRVLVVGVGTGYATAVLSCLVAEVVGVERFRTLVAIAEGHMARLGRRNVELLRADGFDLAPLPPFDRILVLATVASVPPAIAALVKPGGAVLHARPAEGEGRQRQVLVSVERPIDGISKQTIIGPCRLPSLRPGLPARL